MMSNIASPWHYDTGAHNTPEPENIRLPTIWRCAPQGAVSDVAAVVPMSLHGQGAEKSQESVPCPFLGVDRKLKAGRQNDATHIGNLPSHIWWERPAMIVMLGMTPVASQGGYRDTV
jgi:hypothetical protein